MSAFRRWLILAMAAAAALGGLQGRRSVSVAHEPAPNGVARGSAAADDGMSIPGKARGRSGRPAAVVLPSDLQQLDGKAFVDAMPELERRARGGDERTLRLLVSRLQECSSHAFESDEEIRERVDEAWERRRKLAGQYPSSAAGSDLGEDAREAEFKQQIDLRDRCAGLSAAQVGGRIEWVRLALARNDRDAILDFSGYWAFRMSGIERIRYADELGDVARDEQSALDRLVSNGDRDAIARAALAYSYPRNELVPRDPVRAYELAYAWTLAPEGEDRLGMQRLLRQLEANELTPEQVRQAMAAGEALHRRCCLRNPSG